MFQFKGSLGRIYEDRFGISIIIKSTFSRFSH